MWPWGYCQVIWSQPSLLTSHTQMLFSAARRWLASAWSTWRFTGTCLNLWWSHSHCCEAGCWDTCCSSYKCKWNDNFPSEADMRTPLLRICPQQCSLHEWKGGQCLKRKVRTTVGIKKQNSAEKEHLWHWCSDSPGNLISSSCHLLNSVPTIWLWPIKAPPKSVRKIPIHRHKLLHDVQ